MHIVILNHSWKCQAEWRNMTLYCPLIYHGSSEFFHHLAVIYVLFNACVQSYTKSLYALYSCCSQRTKFHLPVNNYAYTKLLFSGLPSAASFLNAWSLSLSFLLCSKFALRFTAFWEKSLRIYCQIKMVF